MLSIRRLLQSVALSVMVLCATPGFAQKSGLLLISIDGLMPEYVHSADKYKLKIPNLRRLATGGAAATHVRGVLPTVTYPSHTTMLTGVWPEKHGIENNTSFDPESRNMSGWNWYAEDIKVRTLWQAAADSGLVVGSISWPVSVAAPGVRYGIPEYWRAVTPDDLKLVKAISSPGLMQELEKDLGKYILDLDIAIPGDRMRTRYAEAILLRKNADVMTIHLAALDHLEHEAGPFSREAFEVLEAIDEMVGVMEKAMLRTHPDATIAIVSDHGFAKTDHQLHLLAALAQAGLKVHGKDWQVSVWSAGGSGLVVVRDRDAETTRRVREMLAKLEADPANGIARVLDRAEIRRLGGGSAAEFIVDLKPGFSIGGSAELPLLRPTKPRGTHGHSPEHAEMNAAFFMVGRRVPKGVKWGEIDMRSIAPTLAKCLGVALPSADLPALKGVCE